MDGIRRFRPSFRQRFQIPRCGLYHGEKAFFTRDASGNATQVQVSGAVFKRRVIGGVSGGIFRITPLETLDQVRTEALAAKPPVETGDLRKPDLVELSKLDPTIKLDIRYATSNNFLSTPIYSEPRAFMQRPAAEALLRAHKNSTHSATACSSTTPTAPGTSPKFLGRDS
jgi:hypothetical protein